MAHSITAMKRNASEMSAPLMKRASKGSAPSPALAKAPIAKVPPVGKAPIAKVPPKAPIAKRPPANQPVLAEAPVTKAFAKKPPPPIPSKASAAEAKAPSATGTPGSASPPGSPPATDAPTRGASWVEFTDVDPLYAMIGELGEKKVVDSEGKILEDRLEEYFLRLTQPGVAEPKDWIVVWAAMDIPVTIEIHSLVVRKIIETVVQSEVGDTVGDILAHLVKGHRAKVKSVEDAITTIFECGCDEKDCIARFLLLIFPKSPTSEWGWSRVGWSWKEWWGIADRICSSLEMSGAFEVLRTLLSAIETDSGTYLPHQQIWDEKRLSIIRGALCRYGNIREDELAAAIDISLS